MQTADANTSMDSGNELILGLKTFPLLAKLPDESLASLSAVMKEERFPAGAVILKEGEPGDKMYLLLEGCADVLQTTLYGDAYVTASLADKDHCTFGDMALIDQDRRSATVRAKTYCRTLSLTREDFQDLCRKYPDAGIEVLISITKTLVRRVRAENDNLKIVYQALIEEIESH